MHSLLWRRIRLLSSISSDSQKWGRYDAILVWFCLKKVTFTKYTKCITSPPILINRRYWTKKTCSTSKSRMHLYRTIFHESNVFTVKNQFQKIVRKSCCLLGKVLVNHLHQSPWVANARCLVLNSLDLLVIMQWDMSTTEYAGIVQKRSSLSWPHPFDFSNCNYYFKVNE